ncbi:CDP-diacylglycerol--serine O-phosphatidyltransferase [Candidatus Dependentiae bacterium]|nr:CDP-diacylglycerol--serine O-phosphatidyltransferase [Candidatus Dependentiae bacterium]
MANMGLGYYAIISALDYKWIQACAVIIIGVLMDGLDGRIARYTKTTSEFGLNFDSLVDVISFGVAPAVVVYHYWMISLKLTEYKTLGWILSFIFVATGAMRLARFNVVSKSDLPNTFFLGLPIPAGAGLLCTMIWIFEKFSILNSNPEYLILFKKLLPLTMLLVSYLMISKIRYYSFKHAKWLFKIPILTIIFIAALLSALFLFPSITLFLIGVCYVCSGPVRSIFNISKLNEKK